jgi:hypothetical protein
MKKLIIAIAFAGSALSINVAEAQVRVNLNISSQPIWGPVGYDNVQNYYLPDIDAYYDVNAQLFYYNSGGRWISARELPPSYPNFDLYRSYKVVINRPHPWMNATSYRRQYAGYRGRHNQVVIRDSRDQRYYANPNHPMHNQWNGGQGQRGDQGHRDNGRDQQHGNNDNGHRNNGRDQQHGNNDNGHDNGHQQEDHGQGHR